MVDSQSPVDSISGQSSDQSSVKYEDRGNPFVPFFVNFFDSIKQFFPQKKFAEVQALRPSEPVKINRTDSLTIQKSSIKDENSKSGTVTFPAQIIVPVKIESQADVAETKTSPVILWQLYAIGGAFILSWAWGKLKERKGKKKSNDEPPAGHD